MGLMRGCCRHCHASLSLLIRRMLFRLCRRDIDSGARGRRLPLRHLAARILDPGVGTLARNHLYADRHEGMIAPAQLGASAIVSCFALDTGPSLVEAPRD